jgi:hypothetical protein
MSSDASSSESVKPEASSSDNPALVALAGLGAAVEKAANVSLPPGALSASIDTSVPTGPEAQGDEEEQIYRGPPIGSKAVKTWPDLLFVASVDPRFLKAPSLCSFSSSFPSRSPNCSGQPITIVVAKIEADRPDLLMVTPTKEGSSRKQWPAGGYESGTIRRQTWSPGFQQSANPLLLGG